MGWACSTLGGKEMCIDYLVGKSEGERPLRRPRRRWEDNIKIDLREVFWGHALDRPGSGEGQVADTCECSNEPSAPIKWGEFLD